MLSQLLGKDDGVLFGHKEVLDLFFLEKDADVVRCETITFFENTNVLRGRKANEEVENEREFLKCCQCADSGAIRVFSLLRCGVGVGGDQVSLLK